MVATRGNSFRNSNSLLTQLGQSRADHLVEPASFETPERLLQILNPRNRAPQRPVGVSHFVFRVGQEHGVPLLGKKR
jgi:hypothetical protein